jgi:hypothetical protein
MKAKYGENVEVGVPVGGGAKENAGVAQITLDGKLLETHSLRRLGDVTGLFIVDPNAADPIRFPFRIDPHQNLAHLERSLLKVLSEQFKQAPQGWLEFTDNDWTIDRCSQVTSGLGLGLIGDVLRLEEGTSCVVSWKGKRPRSMLVFVGRADGRAWLQRFSQRICRDIAEDALQRLDGGTGALPDYAACVLGNQASNSGAGTSLFGAVFSVSRHQLWQGHHLAWIGRIGKE